MGNGLDGVKKMLSGIDDITFSRHFHSPKVFNRGIDEGTVVEKVRHPSHLISVQDQGDGSKGHKYSLLFRKSTRYDLRVVVSVKGKRLNVITAHIQNIRRRKVYEKWLGKLR